MNDPLTPAAPASYPGGESMHRNGPTNQDDLLTPSARWLMGIRMEAPGGGGPAVTTPPAPTPPAAEPAAPAAAEPAAPAAPTPPPATGSPAAADDDPANWDKDRAAQTIKHLRGREGELERQAAAEKKRADDLERDRMSDEQKKEADRKATEEENQRLRQQARSSELLGILANRSDVADAEIARDLLLQRGIQFGEDGKPIDLDAAVTTLLEAKPVLKKDGGSAPAPTPTPGNGGGSAPPSANGAAGSGGQGPPPALNADEVKAANDAGMSPERFASMKGGMSLEEWEAQQKAEREKAAGGGGGS